jgi:hypothetical protein
VYAAGDTNQLGDPSGRFPALAAAPPLAIGAGTVIAAGAGAVVAGGMLYAIYDPQGAAAAVAAVGDAGAAALTTLSNSVSDAQQLTGQPTPANTRGFDWAASPQLSASKSATDARDAAIEGLAGLPSKERKTVSTVVGARDPATGNVSVGVKKSGCDAGKCAEDLAYEGLPGSPDPKSVEFTDVIRPRTGEKVPRCERCTEKFGPEPE